MSAKKAKLLRRVALGLAVQAEEAGRKIDARGTETIDVSVLSPYSTYPELAGISSNPANHRRRSAQLTPTQPRVMVVNRRDTYRGIIRELKKGMK
jgi:hypothetical protein